MSNEFYSRSGPGRDFQLIQDAFDLLAPLAEMNLLAVTHAYAPGSFTIPTGYGLAKVKSLILTGSQRATLEGTARLRIL